MLCPNGKAFTYSAIESVILEFTLISYGYNLYKYHNKKTRLQRTST